MQFANIEWRDGQPYSIDFNDIYFSTDNGIKETGYVFLEQNQLSERFAGLKNKRFTIIETGFGTGLNFYCTASQWLASAPADKNLHFVSIEKFPLKIADLQKIIGIWPQLTLIASALIQEYSKLKAGLNTYYLFDNRIQLDLWIGDIADVLPKLECGADAWFLDGFAPAKNAEMWSTSMFKQLARLSQANTTFATFTSAGLVRRGLQDAGFEVRKLIGFGKKREMLCGNFVETVP